MSNQSHVRQFFIVIGSGFIVLLIFAIIASSYRYEAMENSVVVKARIISASDYGQGIIRKRYHPRITVVHSANGHLDTVALDNDFRNQNIPFKIGDCCYIRVSTTNEDYVDLLSEKGTIICD
jgi:hypothetical protein